MEMNVKIVAIIISIIALSYAIPMDAKYDYDPRPSVAYPGLCDAVAYDINIDLTPPYNSINNASVRITLTHEIEVDMVLLDFEVSMSCDSVIMTHPIYDYWFMCDFRHLGDTLVVELPITSAPGDTFFLTFHYHGLPTGGYYYETNHLGDYVIYTLSWPSNARCWFPCIDFPADKATATITITAPSNLDVAANGTMVTHHFVMAQPICSYNICFAAADYAFWENFSGSGVPIWYFAYPEDSVEAAYDWGRTPEMVDSFEMYFGEYPFDRYGMATTPFGLGGMEHQTMTFLGDGIVRGDRRYEDVVAHELSHSWFGNSVGLADWRDFWVNEGFATFAEFVFTEIFSGDIEAADYRSGTQYRYMISGENFPMYDPDEYLSYTCYNKGGCVLEMLRFLMGDSLFFAAVREWTGRYRYRTVTTDSLKALMEEFYGSSLDWFFDQWVYQPGYPTLKYSYASWRSGESFFAILRIDQDNTSGPDVFITPVEIEIETEAGSIWDTIWLDTLSEEFVWELSDSLIRFVIDPNYRILRNAVRVTSVDEFSQKPAFDISIEPNPFNQTCRILIPGDSETSKNAEIFDQSGRLIQKFANVDNEILWDASGLPSATYFVRVSAGKSAVIKRVLNLR